MATGLPTSTLLEIEFTAGVWTNVTSFVQPTGVALSFGRADEFGSVQPATLTVTLDNYADATTGYCPFTPDSPVSPYYPNVVEGKRIRFSITKGSTYQRFIGYIDAWAPFFTDDPAIGSVVVTASDLLAPLSRRILGTALYEVLARAETLSPGFDYFPLDEAATATIARNNSTTGQSGVVIPSTARAGSLTFAAGSPSTVLAEGTVTGSPDASALLAGPVLAALLYRGAGGVVGIGTSFRTSATTSGVILAGYNYATGALEWTLRVQSNNLGLYDPSGTLVGTVLTNANDGNWHTVHLIDTTFLNIFTDIYTGGPSALGGSGYYAAGAKYLATIGSITIAGAIGSAGNQLIFSGDVASVATDVAGFGPRGNARFRQL